MIRKKPFQRQLQQPRITANNNIRFPELRVLDDMGEMVGVLQTREALQMARDQEKDLVLITESAQPPIAKIINLAKYRYQMQQKKAEGRKKAKVLDMKEIRLTPFMGEGDFQSRLKKIVTFLEKGHKVRLTLEFRGREITKQEFGRQQFNRVFEATQEIATQEIAPKMLGKKLLAQLMPVKKK